MGNTEWILVAAQLRHTGDTVSEKEFRETGNLLIEQQLWEQLRRFINDNLSRVPEDEQVNLRIDYLEYVELVLRVHGA